MSSIPFITAAEVRAALSPVQAVAAIEQTLRAGFDPADDLPRSGPRVAHGEFLLMPSRTQGATGIKLLTVSYDNPSRGLPVIQGVYLLVDHVTLAPLALLDGAALTSLRTPAVTLAACRPYLALSDAPLDVVICGTGTQGAAHGATVLATLDGIRPVQSLTYISHSGRTPGDLLGPVLAADSPAATQALTRAGFIICATTATTPLFDSRCLRDDAVVAAVGSHHPDRRELDSALLGRSQVVVEAVSVALREAGDVVIPVAEGVLDPASLVELKTVVGIGPRPPSGPVVFKSVGMSWEDLALAAAITTIIGLT